MAGEKTPAYFESLVNWRQENIPFFFHGLAMLHLVCTSPLPQSNYYQHSKFVKLIPSEIMLGGSKSAFLTPLQTRSEISGWGKHCA